MTHKSRYLKCEKNEALGRKRIKGLTGFRQSKEKLLERGSRALSGAKLLVLLLRAKRTKCVQIFTFDAKIQETLSACVG